MNRLHAFVLLTLLLPCASMDWSWTADFPAVSALGTQCPLPEDLKGTTGHVLYRYLLGRNDEAKQIKPLWIRVEPESRREAFLDATTACLQQRAGSGRSPDPLGSVRYLAFHFVAEPPKGSPRVRLGPGRSVPLPWLEEMQEQKHGLARQILSEPVLREHSAPGVKLLSNVGATAFREIAEGIDFTRRAFDQAFPGARPVPEDAGLTLLVFRDTEGYHQLAAFDDLASRTTSGAQRYQPWDRFVYAAAPHDRPYRWTAGLLSRDLARHLVVQRLAPAGSDLPYWVVEGLSSFFQCLKWTSDQVIDLSLVERQKEIRGFYKYRQPGAVMLERMGTMGAANLPPFTELLEDYPPMQGPERLEFIYAPAWIAVHYLINGEAGALRAPFQRWIEDADTEKNVSTLSLALDKPLPSLDSGLREHLKATW